MGFFGGLNTEKYDRQYSDRQLVRRITEYFKPQTRRLMFVSVLVVVIAGVGAMLPVVVSRIVDLLKEQPTVQSIGLAVALFLVGVGIWGLNWARRALVVRSVGRCRCWNCALGPSTLPPSMTCRLRSFSSGRIVSRITADTDGFGQLVVIVTDVSSQMFRPLFWEVILSAPMAHWPC